jgi:predicted phage terminase large subunit-like protein
MNQRETIDFLVKTPYKLGQLLGFNSLTELHNEWIRAMIYGEGDETLQAHRGSYKTTCVSIALTIIIILYPNEKTMFNRKTDTDVQEVVAQVKKMLLAPETQYITKCIWGQPIILTKDKVNELSTSLTSSDPRGTSQLFGMGIKGSITGKHFDRIFTDDIINVTDRISKAEREKTKLFYQELQNVKNRGGRIFNTGTPWHKDDAFTLMPNPKVYDCYSTGLIGEEELNTIRSKMTASLFAANYEMRHIASDDIIFQNPVTGGDVSMIYNGESHIDAAYGGEDGSAFTICRKFEGKYYVLGKLRHKHIDNCEDEFIELHNEYLCSRLSCETNADKGYLAKELRKKGIKIHKYAETTNKFMKITTYLRSEWVNVVFVEGTDREYIEQICDYTIDAEHDDAPDSLASLIRQLWNKKDKNKVDDDYYTHFI